jgi:hypothetical protein
MNKYNIYNGITKKYRIIERIFYDGITEYYIQWKYRSWYGLVWNGKCAGFDRLSPINDPRQFNMFYSIIAAEQYIYMSS